MKILGVITFDLDESVHVLIVDNRLAKQGYIEDWEPLCVQSLHIQLHLQLIFPFDALSLQALYMFFKICINFRHVLVPFDKFQVFFIIFSNLSPDVV